MNPVFIDTSRPFYASAISGLPTLHFLLHIG